MNDLDRLGPDPDDEGWLTLAPSGAGDRPVGPIVRVRLFPAAPDQPTWRQILNKPKSRSSARETGDGPAEPKGPEGGDGDAPS